MPFNCPKCSSVNYAKKGFRHNTYGRKQKYRCKDCKAWFVRDDGFKRMRHKPEDITRAVHLHIDGLSLSKAKNHIYQYDNVSVCRQTINNWTKKYSVFLKSDKSKRKADNKGTLTFG